MNADIDAAIQFIYANARLLDRRRLELLVGATPPDSVVEVLRPYQPGPHDRGRSALASRSAT